MSNQTLFHLIGLFFNQRLISQLHASANTIASYRDTFKLLLIYAGKKLGKSPANLTIEELNAELIGDFLNYLEEDRRNSIRTRNARLAAIHSFFRYIAYQQPQHGNPVQRILNIPQKKSDKRIITYLTDEEVKSILEAPDRTSWIGKRDHALLLTAIQTGLRVSELIELKIEQIKWGVGAHIRCVGKGRKERCTPLTNQTEKILREWLKENNAGLSFFVFPSIRGRKLSRDAVEKLVKKYASKAKTTCPTLKDKNITPHVLRHTTAVSLLHAEVDTSLIALYLGHESVETTQIYLKADLCLKEKVLAKVIPVSTVYKRFKPSDKLLAFLDEL